MGDMFFVATSAPREYEYLIVLQLWIERNHPTHEATQRFQTDIAKHYLAIAGMLQIASALMDEERWTVFLVWRRGVERSFFFQDMAPEVAEAVKRMRFARIRRLTGTATPQPETGLSIDRLSHPDYIHLQESDRPLEEFREILSVLAYTQPESALFPNRLIRAAYILEAEIPHPVLHICKEEAGRFHAKIRNGSRGRTTRSLLRILCEVTGYP